MRWTVFGIFAFMAIITLVLGIAVKYLKAYWLISGYNTMSLDKKKNVDIEGLGNFVGDFCFVLTAIIFLSGILMAFGKEMAGTVVLFLLFPLMIYVLIFAQKYDGNTRNADGTMNTKTKVIIGGISLFLVATVVGTGSLIYQSNKPAEFKVGDGVFEIGGLYGESIDLDDIKDIMLKDTMPDVRQRTNGSSIGSKKKGYFRLDGALNAKLFVDDAKPPFIFVETSSKLIILNCESSKKTEELYNALKSEWNSIK